VIRALLYLRSVSLRNRIAGAARRLRQPKYLASFVVGALYCYFFFLRRMHLTSGGLPLAAITPAALATVGGALLLIALLARTALAWNASSAEARLKFSDAEVAFLFPAPLSRRRLIHFHLLGSQLSILLTSVAFTLLTNRWSFLGGNALTHAVGWWIILSTFSLFGNAMNFVASRTQQLFGSGLRRRVLTGLLVLTFILVRALWKTAQPPPDFVPGDFVSGYAGYMAAWLQSALGSGVLLIFRWIVAPFAAPTIHAFALAVGPALLLPAICYAAVILLEVPFREGSMASAQRRAEFVAARRTGSPSGVRGAVKLRARKSPFQLRGQGRPEMAFLWKNLIGIQSWFNWRILAILLGTGAFFILTLLRKTHPTTAAAYAPLVLITAAFAAFYVMLLGPQLVRQDLRSDLLNADLLKGYPLPGWQIVFGQMLTPAILLTGMLWLLALAVGWAAFSGYSAAEVFSAGTRLTLLGCIGIVIPPVVILQLVVPNAAALLFPAWHQTTRTRAGGVEAMGQRLIFTLGQFLMVAIALLPAVVVAALVVLASNGWSYILAAANSADGASADSAHHSVALILATICVLGIVLGEVGVGIWWLGKRFERLDIASELKP